MEKYLLVGTTEEIGDFVTILEATIPRIFKGATKLFSEGNFCILVTFKLFLTASHFFLISAQTKTLCLSARLQNSVHFFNVGTRERITSYCRDRDMQMSHSLIRSRRTS